MNLLTNQAACPPRIAENDAILVASGSVKRDNQISNKLKPGMRLLRQALPNYVSPPRVCAK